ncbi:MAG: IS110 family transposase [Brevundimonas sp.]|uniref:IS110 family transposase n=1 Tax=Brevundimonas sp. TaxID=1871086 RepID=UPI002AB90218|nr:IS110 family transposase [Brevundimonas sp.]MDZ4113050.1 IS110 family transposase [Brevundimonas sp.]
MTTMTCAAGVDVGRDWLDVAVAPAGRAFRAPNAPGGLKLVTARLKRAGVARVVLESIGTYGTPLVRALAQAGFQVGVVDPRRVKALRLAEGRRAKTDRLDAALIARFALLMTDVARPLPSAEAMEIRALSTRRRQVVELAAAEKTRLKQALDEEIADSCRRLIAGLEAERARVEALLEMRLAADPANRRRAELLRTIPGVGPAVITTLLADLPELGTLDRRSVASLTGLAPHPDQSGTRTGRAHIGGGRSCVRTALYMAALSASRSDRGLKREYQALRDAEKPAKVALTAIARRLAVAANSMIKADQPWNHA